MLNRLPIQTTNRPIDVVLHWRKEGFLELNPPYQRGDVWGPVRQRNLIRSLMLGIPIPSIVVNDRFEAGGDYHIAVIDGKQRITAILKFLDNRLAVPGEWFGIDREWVTYEELSVPQQRKIRQQSIGFSEARLPDLEAEIEVFELINYGGVPQGESDHG